MKALLVPSLCGALLISALAHLFFPVATEKYMSRNRSVRAAGAVLLAFTVAALASGLLILGVLLAVFALPRLLVPDRSIRLQRLYPRRVHGALLLLAAATIWLVFRRPGG